MARGSFYNGQQAAQTGNALQGDVSSVVRDARDPNGFVPMVTGTEGLLREEQQIRQYGER